MTAAARRDVGEDLAAEALEQIPSARPGRATSAELYDSVADAAGVEV